MKHQEHIVAVRKEAFDGAEGGFKRLELEGKDLIIAQRAFLETTEDYRQIIPATVVVCKGRIWAYQRASSGGESRLHNKVAVAIGGHWDIDDIVTENSIINLNASLDKAARRELQEEVHLDSLIQAINHHTHFIVSNETEVDRCHAAQVTFVELSDPMCRAAEKHLKALGWFTPKELLESDQELETWTVKICQMLIRSNW